MKQLVKRNQRPPKTSIKQTDVVLVVGKRGYGKTTLIRKLLAKMPPKKVFVYDFNGEYQDYEFAVMPRDGSQKESERMLRSYYSAGNAMLVLSEADVICSGSSVGYWMKRTLHTSRHRNLGIIVESRRCGSLHPVIKSQCNHLFLFQTTLPLDINFLEDMTGESMKEAKTLGVGDYIYWTPSHE